MILAKISEIGQKALQLQTKFSWKQERTVFRGGDNVPCPPSFKFAF